MKITPVKKVWINGKFVSWDQAKVHVLTHALQYGIAVFEGMRCYSTSKGSAVFRMKDHYRRFVDGCKSYQFELGYTVDELCEITKKLIKMNKLKQCYIRPIVYSGFGEIGLDISGVKFDIAICAIPFGKYFGEKATKGISCGTSSWRRMKGSVLSPHVKASANYLNSALAKKEAHDAGYDEAVMLIDNGHVAEGSGENLFIIRNGKLITPPLHDGILAGITRASLIDIAKELDIPVEERSILRDEIYTADEVFMCGTAAEITPVTSVDKRKISRGAGPITSKLKNSFFNIVSGNDERFIKWLDFVDK